MTLPLSESATDVTSYNLNKLFLSFKKIVDNEKEYHAEGGAPNGKYYRTYNQREATEATGINHKAINSACEQLGIDYRDGKKWCIDYPEMLQLRDAFGGIKPFKRPADSKCSVWSVSILKGGTGKTTVSTTLAAGLAGQLHEQYRVLLVDLDPQSTATKIYAPKFTDDDVSIGDLMMWDDDDDETMTVAQASKAAITKTNIHSLDILCSKDDDREYEVYVKEKENEATVKGESYASYKDLQKVIDAVADDYDVVLIDTPPHFSASNLAAHYVANNLLIPIRPAENDWDSSYKYLRFLNRVYKYLSALGHPGYDNIKMLISAQKSNSRTQERIAQKIRVAASMNHMLSNVFPDSDAVQACGELNSTIYDLSESDFPGTKKSLRKAHDDVLRVVHEFELTIRDSFRSE
ncbi:ParA family protein [Shewanella sp. YLB-07]|uniref:ParA family protein n=1 Tax=Shewanella sp. YLB-07 TaxID=2601268 RepID=UPI00128B687D|nr:ParA family protein [Shewanella sp. YLB-07]MPY24406.1 ParA family protein [Shewanella sp. YLB-07]